MPESWTFSTVILGAGHSSRMGRPKLLLPWGDTTVLGHQVRQWTRLGARQVAVVCQPGDAAMNAELDRLQILVEWRISNPDPDRGMFSSIQCAARWDGWNGGVKAIALALGDQPHLSTELLSRTLHFAQAHPDRICQPSRAGHGRHPVLIPLPCFRELAASTASTLKDFLASHAAEIELLELDDPSLDLDLDQPEDYEQALARFLTTKGSSTG